MTKLGSLVDINPDPPATLPGDPISVIELADIDAETATVSPRVLSGTDEVKKGHHCALPGDVLFARISPSMENGKLAIATIATPIAAVSRELIILRPKPGVDPKLIWAFLRVHSVRRALRSFMVGSAGRARLRPEVLREVRIPDLGQSWPASKEALERLDNARQLHRRVDEKLRALPAAVVSTFSAPARTAALGGFEVELFYGTSKSSVERGTVPLLRPSNVSAGSIETTELRFLPVAPSDNYFLRAGDLLLVRTGTSTERVGRAAAYDGVPIRASFASSLICVRGRPVDIDFLWACLQTEETRSELLSRASLRGDQYSLSLAALRQLPIPRLSSQRQGRIGLLVRQLRPLLRRSTGRLELLDQAIEAHLATTFAYEAPVVQAPKEEQRALMGIFAPTVFEAASSEQKRIWEAVAAMSEGFGLRDLTESESEYASLRRTLGVLEQLGVVIREQTEHSYRWRPPDPELELLS